MSNEEASTSNAEDDKRFWKSLEVASAKQGQDFPLESKHWLSAHFAEPVEA